MQRRMLGLAAAAALAGAAGCSDFGGKAAVLGTAADETPCSKAELKIVSEPGQGQDETYVVEGCGQRLTYQVTLAEERSPGVPRVELTAI